MRKKNYKGRCEKRKLTKCDGICKTYDELQYVYANLVNASNDVKSFQVNVYLEGLEEGEYTSDFVITKVDGDLMVIQVIAYPSDAESVEAIRPVAVIKNGSMTVAITNDISDRMLTCILKEVSNA